MKIHIALVLIFISAFSLNAQINEVEPNDCFIDSVFILTACKTSTLQGSVNETDDFNDVWFIDTTFNGDVTLDIVSGDIEIWVVSYWDGSDTFGFCDGEYHMNVTPANSPISIPEMYKDYFLGFIVSSTNGQTAYQIAIGFEDDYCGTCPTSLMVENPIDQVNYEASETVISNGTIIAGDSVRFSAPTINLNSGFTVESGAILKTDSTGCD